MTGNSSNFKYALSYVKSEMTHWGHLAYSLVITAMFVSVLHFWLGVATIFESLALTGLWLIYDKVWGIQRGLVMIGVAIELGETNE